MSCEKDQFINVTFFLVINCWLRHAVGIWKSSFYRANCPANLNLLNGEELYLHCEYTKSVIESVN